MSPEAGDRNDKGFGGQVMQGKAERNNHVQVVEKMFSRGPDSSLQVSWLSYKRSWVEVSGGDTEKGALAAGQRVRCVKSCLLFPSCRADAMVFGVSQAAGIWLPCGAGKEFFPLLL